MLAYVFWHWPLEGTDAAAYEDGQIRFQQSLARQPPAGLQGSASFRIERLPWFEEEGPPRYEDWYVVEDWTALGVLEQAAVGAGHRSAHERAASHAGGGAGGVYRLVEGIEPALDAVSATWVTAPPRTAGSLIGELLADGGAIAVWRRALVLGPAPEWCLLGAAPPPGVEASRLPVEWTALSVARTTVTDGG
jgi:hypothetical protein